MSLNRETENRTMKTDMTNYWNERNRNELWIWRWHQIMNLKMRWLSIFLTHLKIHYLKA